MRWFNRGAVLNLLFAIGCAARPVAYENAAPSPVASDTTRLTLRAPIGREAPVAAEAPVERNPRNNVLSDAGQQVGTPYRYGGSTPDGGFDCSGFVQWIFARQGIELPRTARAMSTSGTRVAARRTVLAPGDLLFFAEKGAPVSHVAIYAGDGRIIHASSGQGTVRYDDLDSARGQWFRKHVVLARRVIDGR